MPPQGSPFKTDLLGTSHERKSSETQDTQESQYGHNLPAAYMTQTSRLATPSSNIYDFLRHDFSLERLEKISGYLGFAGSRRLAFPLHAQICMDRTIVISERMDHHLLWSRNGTLFVKPVPRFLLDPNFWQDHLTCPANCPCLPGQGPACRQKLRGCALGFLFSYACLVAYEQSDFVMAQTRHLLPERVDNSPISWQDWRKFAGEIMAARDREAIHERFERAELRLSRLNNIYYFTQWPLFMPYYRTWRDYSNLFRSNAQYLATVTISIALILTAMQVGLATNQLQSNEAFVRASYGFTIFAIFAPIGILFLAVVAAAYNLIKDLPYILMALKRRETIEV